MGNETHGHRKRTCEEGKKKRWDGTYGSWREMKRRCLDPGRRDFQYYGAIGVQVCPRWLAKPGGFEAFLEDLGPRPEGYTLDRINPYGHYEPENCRWRPSLDNSSDNRRARDYYQQYADSDEETLFQVHPKWPELLVIPRPSLSGDEADLPF